MSNFKALMMMSRVYTERTQKEADLAMAQRQQKEALRRKQQEEAERKERQQQEKERALHFENMKKAHEREKRLEQERSAKEAELARRTEEQREALRYGPKKAKALAATNNSDDLQGLPTKSMRSETSKYLNEDGNSRRSSPALALKREEKRQRKAQAELRRAELCFRRPSPVKSPRKDTKRLPGGAIDVTVESSVNHVDSSPPGSQSVKARLAAIPNVLTKLNAVKRDTRTIDEILQDRAKARDNKVLDGDQARGFSNWFGTSQKEEATKTASSSASVSDTDSPPSQSLPTESASQLSVPTSSTKSTPSTRATSWPPEKATSDQSTKSKSLSQVGKSLSTKSDASSAGSRPSLSSSSRKRPRSPSPSPSPPPPSKKRVTSARSSLQDSNSLSTEIWSLFGKDRNAYVRRDVDSDEDEMEAGVQDVWEEEMRSERIARREDILELEAEKRREEEKRRKRRERELLTMRQQT